MKNYLMPEAKPLLFQIYGNTPQLKIVNYLLEAPKNTFTQTEIIQDLGLSKTTFQKYFPFLLDHGLLKVSKQKGKTKFYSIDLQSPIVHSILFSISRASDKIADRYLLRKKLVKAAVKWKGDRLDLIERQKRMKFEMKLITEQMKTFKKQEILVR